MDKLILPRMEFYGYHGVFAEENKLGHRFYVHVELHMPLDKPGPTDNIVDSINYAEAY
ncbi:dihydroneopterin aldolase, partial [Paenibacillus sp. GbtcB18]|uniref:dihydroneopterin aldolase n=1 Tax=Paenibacillus sp. GbtcB18 TaxID=2824763 RepID=UPI001C307003